MHELGIARNILDIVKQHVPDDKSASVRRIRVRVGQLSGVVPDSLEFCFSALLSEAGMKGAGLVMESVPTISRCRECGNRFEVENFVFSCPACEGVNLELVSGKELEIVDIELADE
ncbi:MAG: hydrogenase maturation nickel metallochaperone HypA [Acidobacteriota bacterium]